MARRVQLKPLNQQVIVITGASSGIGLATARLAAQKGAKVVLAARGLDELHSVEGEIRRQGGDAVVVDADVASPEAVERIATAAMSRFGRIDTWVNNAGVSIYGKLYETHLEDKRRLFDVDFWGVVHGCRSALPRMRERGGAIINIGSVLSDMVVPLQGVYAAAKHAVKGYTDALRLEVEEEGWPISISLVKPSAISTPYFENAKSLMAEGAPRPTPPLYEPEVVARVILRCAQTQTRSITVGGGGRLLTAVANLMPRLTDKYMEATMFSGQINKSNLNSPRPGNLYRPSHSLRARAQYGQPVFKHSMFTSAALHPRSLSLVALALGIVGLAYYRRSFLRDIETEEFRVQDHHSVQESRRHAA